jgi:hypothetical protein
MAIVTLGKQNKSSLKDKQGIRLKSCVYDDFSRPE